MTAADTDTINRLKTLSKAQTALLKAYLHEKLVHASKIVKKASSHLDSTTEKDLIRELDSLKLEELEVDFESTKLLLSNELSLLRNAIKDPSSVSSTQSVLSSTSSAELEDLKKKIESLTLENKNKEEKNQTIIDELTKKLEEKNEEITVLKKKLEESNKNSESSSSDSNELNELKQKLIDADANLEKFKKDTKAKFAVKVKEITDLKNKEIEDLKNEKKLLEETTIKFADDIEKDTKSRIQEIEDALSSAKNDNSILKKKYNDLKIRLEKHKTLEEELKKKNSNLHSSILEINKNFKLLSEKNKKIKDEVSTECFNFLKVLKTKYSAEIVNKLGSIDGMIKVYENKYKRELQERKKLHNIIQELKGNIRVYMRCRPPSQKELEGNGAGSETICVSFPNAGEVKVVNEKNREKVWEFDETFDFNSTQQQVYDEVSGLVTSVLDGYNVCIFAYGQTGSGKTFTMSGPPDNRGVNTRALEDLFRKSNERSEDFSDTISVSLLEVYNEEIRDLLNESGVQEKLDVKMGEHGNYVPGLRQVPVSSIEDVFTLMVIADKNRSSTYTNMNEHSSRSHMMLTVTVTSVFKSSGATSRGKLNLVDLAGSERINKSGAQGVALKEAQNINKSLSALGDVIAARASKASHIPFRNSTLTYLLQDSLSQDSKTLMIVCISPVIFNAEETFCSLNFAARVRTVELGKATKNTTSGNGNSNGGLSKTPSMSQVPTTPRRK